MQGGGRLEAQASRRASLTLRVPEEKLDAFLQGAGELGRVISQTETAQDVTASYQDIAARLATQQAKMERLQALMSETATLSELLELESAIADTQYTLDSLQSQLNQTDDQVAYATVDVSLRRNHPRAKPGRTPAGRFEDRLGHLLELLQGYAGVPQRRAALSGNCSGGVYAGTFHIPQKAA